MENRRRQRKRRKVRYGWLILSGVALVIVGALILMTFANWHKRTDIGQSIPPVQEQEVVDVISEADQSLLEDYELVRQMLMAQDMNAYPSELVTKIEQQNALIRDELVAQALPQLEHDINELARLIDEPLFSGTPSEVFYARGLLILNKQHEAPANFEPGNRQVMSTAFAQMKEDAAAQGINLYDFSSYRGYYAQKSLFERYAASDGEEAANRYSARAGFSEHQTGFVTDIGGDNRSAWAETTFDDTTEAKWLAENADRYGFIMRYPPGKETITGYIHESWHYRYIGPIATKVKTSGLTLEEYLGLV
jgi:D-alanyl-D-alanine carboxypeptidase